ncbi:hypothetical protein [Actinocorallia sp. A-T 12471]|uniref:hypothetical protein n=1 Tax=Actinocorallia sp. A-T 12471 TaxID=3089813 RepID=UPI0029D3E9FD|nr:hypothetical protein [Actinocorallia sp. A-T 12471]MDX6744742.1 hypothetical protein [Actinocorallia sp. A-T 12471]
MTGSLARALGMAEHARVLLVGAPPAFDLGELPGDVLVTSALPDTPNPGAGEESWDVVLAFCDDRPALEAALPDLVRSVAPSGSVWIAWPEGGLDPDAVRVEARGHALIDGGESVEVVPGHTAARFRPEP